MKRKQITSVLLSFALAASAFSAPFAQIPVFAAEEASAEENAVEDADGEESDAADEAQDQQGAESFDDDEIVAQEDADEQDGSTAPGNADDSAAPESDEEIIEEADPSQDETDNGPKDAQPGDFIFKGTVSASTDGQEAMPEDNSGKSSDDLFADYVDNSFGIQDGQPASGRKRAPRSAASGLSGSNRAIYDSIAGYLPAIAAGERASTVFEFNIEEINLEKTSWTAGELGVASILAVDENGNIIIDDDGYASISAEAFAAVERMKFYDLSKITSALLADHPYQLYWYEKTQPTRSTGCEVTTYYDETAEDYVIAVVGDFTISFPVAEEYAAGTYTVDTSIGQAVQASVANANEIVEQYSGAADYNKLLGYKDEICDLVSYNHDAAGGGASYGNPWQMIWVFDEDPATNVVCEGYAKAFKYLCDQSDFSGDISCITVSGTMDDGTGAGNHMWNIVNMEDGQNYLVDVTNCDEGTIGEPDLLFLAGVSSGDIETGYIFNVNNESVVYVYDEKTKSVFEISDLTISNDVYIDPLSGEQTQDEWTYCIVNGRAVITNYSGHEETVVVPANLGQFPVDGIGNKVFYGNNNIKRIVISEGIKWLSFGHVGIGGDSFPSICGCRSLTSISLPSTLDLSGFVINKSGSYINECDALETIEVSELNPYIKSVDNVLYSKDGRCLITYPSAKKDRIMVVPEGVEYILDYAFAENYFDLEEVVLPSTIKEIGMMAFGNDYKLRSLNIPDGCEFIGQFFIANTCIEELSIPASVTRIMQDAFYAVNSIERLIVDDNNPYYSTDDNILRTDSVLLWYFPGQTQKEYTVPEGIASIAQGAFHNAKKLESLVIPEGVVDIDKQVFFDCFALKHISIPLSLTYIGEYSFSNCSKLTEVDYPGTFEQWGEIYIEKGNDFLNAAAAVRLNQITVSGDYNSIHWELDDNVLSITGEGPIDESSSYPWMAYRLYIKELVIHEGITEIPSNAFADCLNLSAIDLPDSLLSIKNYAFIRCSGLIEVNIPKNVIDIGSAVFGRCPGIESMSVDADNPVYDSRENCNAIILTGDNRLIQGCRNTIIPDSVSGIGWSAFVGCTQLETISIPDSVYSIEPFAFQNCAGLTEIELPDSLFSIGDGAFSECTGLTSVRLPENVSCGERLFYGCTNLTDIQLPDSLSYIPDFMFFECSNLQSIQLPDNVTGIGVQAFLSCSKLQEITLPDQVTTIGENAFENCKSLTSITIPAGVTVIPNNVFNECSSLRDVYYGGPEESWNSVSIGEWNKPLMNAEKHFSAVGVKIVTQPSDVVAENGQRVTFHVEADGSDLTYQWQYNKDGVTWNNCTSKGYNTDTFSFMMLASLGGRQYRCIVTSGDEQVISDAADLILKEVLKITKQPVSVEAAVGDRVSFIVKANKADATYQWQYNKDGATWNNCTSRGYNKDTFSFTVGSTMGNRQYRCVVTSGDEQVISDAAELILKEALKITEQPQRVEAAVGERVSFHVTASKTDATYQWQYNKDGATWNNCTSKGYNKDTFSFTMVASLGGRQYRCVVTSGDEQVISDAVDLIRNESLKITKQPENAEAAKGERVSLHVEANKADVTYQWQYTKDGATWNNCTSKGYNTDTFSFTMGSTMGGRQYRCVVTSGDEQVTSDAADLTLKEALKITKQPESVAAAVGAKVSFHVEANKADVTYQWQYTKDGTTWNNCTSKGYNKATFSFTMGSTMGNRQYRCVVSDGILTVYSDAASLSIESWPASIDGIVYDLVDGNVTVVEADQAIVTANIRSEVNGKPVTRIGERVFEWHNDLITVVIPDTVIAIGGFAFKNCDSLSSVTLSNGLQTIGEYAFTGNRQMTDLAIPDSVTSIGAYAFMSSGLEHVTISNSVTEIDDYTFAYCRQLQSAVVPDGVTRIGLAAFGYDTSLSDITIPESVTTIDRGAFCECESLASFYIPDGVNSINGETFRSCSSITEYIVGSGNQTLTAIDGVLFSKDGTLLVSYPGGKSDSAYTIPDSVVRLCSYAFDGCSNLTDLTLSNGVECIDWMCFSDCPNLEHISIPASMTELNQQEFYNCPELTDIEVARGNPVLSSEDGILFNKAKTTIMVYPAGKTDSEYSVPATVTKIEIEAFRNCDHLMTVHIPETVIFIGDYAFAECDNLDSIELPDGLTSIYGYTFYNCSCLRNVTIPDSVMSIDDHAFAYCPALEEVVIPDQVTALRQGTFMYCGSLHIITIPESVAAIEDAVFMECYNLTDIYYGGSQSQWDGIDINPANNDYVLENATIHYAE